MISAIRPHHQEKPLWVLLLLGFLSVTLAQAAPPPLSIKSAAYHKKAASLIVKTQVKEPSGLLTLLHSKGGVLGQTSDSEHTFTIPLAQLGEVPCQVEARLGELSIRKSVAGAPAECKKAPLCKILAPTPHTALQAKVKTTFEAQVALKDKKAAPLTIEWDFAGGVMGHPFERLLKDGKPVTNGKVTTDVSFVRDNSRYHVRFAAIDNKGRRCESGVYVDVGTPPSDLPPGTALKAMVGNSQANAPAKGSALKIPAGEKVVLPYQDWTMQTATDARTVPNVYVVYGPQVNNINAIAYKKDRKPPVVSADEIELNYSAASNPADPVGPNSINSTSQNWPLDAPLQQASVQKSDFFETFTRPVDAILAEGYTSYSFTGFLSPELATAADEGYHNSQLIPPFNSDHGQYMPGIAAPYAANDPQPFNAYVSSDNAFAAKMLPLTDIDDSGRVNPTPLFRIEARDAASNTPVAITDLAVSASRDFHCRECHAKGKMGSERDFSKIPTYPFIFQEPDSDSIFDQEYAAVWNTASIHTVAGRPTVRMETGDTILGQDGLPIANVPLNDGPAGCSDASGGCHTTAMSTTAYGKPIKGAGYGKPLSVIVHGDHSGFQFNASRDGVLRSDTGSALGLGWDDWDPQLGSIPNSVFPVKDTSGNILPMEENCLKCHGGQREQSYRDRMYTAGVTCYQCHGDMLAVAGQFKPSAGPDGRTFRQPWIDEPDCGSCHTGNANQGKAGNEDFFSGGVRRLAFDKNDRTATPRQPDLFNPDEIRFAVPITSLELGNTEILPDGTRRPFITKTPLYRVGKDNHGQVPCGACHGAAHAIWPNRDPNANDNVTALQLQGHNGSIAECSVCHTADSFAKFEDLDEGIRAADAKTGILGGPHNMHPVYDPNWWKEAAGDTVDSTPTQPKRNGIIKGGWHNDYAKIPGRVGEDQCAACHGNDHLGTRLSKTPVDREFINEKGKKVKVKAGTPIGCNLCHTIAKSCTASPSGAACGKPSEQITRSANLAPVFTSASETHVVLGQEYRHDVDAKDPEGAKLSYEFLNVMRGEASIDSGTGVVTLSSQTIANVASGAMVHAGHHLVIFHYYVVVRDSQGALTSQLINVNLECPAGLVFDIRTRACVKISLSSDSPINQLVGGDTYRYQVIANQSSGEPLTYTLAGQPEGMDIDGNSGLIIWKTPDHLTDQFSFTVTASNQQGDSVAQQISLTVCSAPQYWNASSQSCLGPVSFTSNPSLYGVTAGAVYSDTATATHANNLPLTYSLSQAPAGMTIDASSGLINWVAQANASGPVNYTVKAADGEGGLAQTTLSVLVCAAPEIWDGYASCKGPIEFTSVPVSGVDPGQTYQYQVTVSHANGLTLTYSLGDYPNNLEQGIPAKPTGMSINPQTGLISWLAEAQPVESGGYAYFAVIATDSQGYVATQAVQAQVCEPPTNWDNNLGYCRGPVRITSTPSVLGCPASIIFSGLTSITLAGFS